MWFCEKSSTLVTLLASLFYFFSIASDAQPALGFVDKPVKIAYFGGAKPPRAQVVRDQIAAALQTLGHKQGVDYEFVTFSTEGDNHKLRDVGMRVVASHPDIVYAGSWDTAKQIKELTATIPIVFSAWANLESPTYRIVENMGQPEANLTGFTSYVNLIPKKLQILREAFPGIKKVGFIYGVDIRDERRAEYSDAASKLGLTLVYRKITKDDIKGLAEKIDAFGDDAYLIAHDDLLLYNKHADKREDDIVGQLAKVKAPLVYPEEATGRGVLMHYFSEMRWDLKAAEYISKLLRGAKVRDLAVQEPQEFDFSVNMTTLRRNGLTMSRDVLARARKVE